MVGEEMPESKTSEFVPREEPRIERQEAEPLGHTDVAGEGTYLYGNVRAADVTVEKALELGPDVLNVHRELEMLSFDVGELFDQLHARADEREELSDEIKAAFHEALEQLEAELMLGREASEDRIARHLRKMEALDPGFLELVLAGLRHTRTEAQFLVQSAIDRMSG